KNGTAYLHRVHDHLLRITRQDLAALEEWCGFVRTGQAEFDRRFRQEYLAGAKFHRFDEALVRLLDLLELPGAGRVISQALWILRTPYRLVKGLAVKALRRPDPPSLPEQPLLIEALSGWIDLLRMEAARRGKAHAVWAHI